MMHEGRLRRRLSGFVGRLILFALLATAGLVVYLWAVGLPHWLVDVLLSRIEIPGFVIDADGVCLEPPGWVILRNARIYRKRVVGPPALYADSVSLLLDPYAGLTRKQWTRRIRIADAEFRPSLLVAGAPLAPEIWIGGWHEPVNVVVANCHMEGIVFEEIAFDVLQDGPLVVFMNVKGTVTGEGVRGDFEGGCNYDVRARELNGHARTALDPHVLLPVLRYHALEDLTSLVERLGFAADSPPDADLVFKWRDVGPATSVDVKFQAENMTYNGVGAREVTGRAAVNSGPGGVQVRMERLFVVREEGNVEAGFTISSPDGEVRFDGISRIAPDALIRLIGLSTNLLSGLHFQMPVQITARGRANYHDVEGTDFRALVESAGVRLGVFTAVNCRFGMAMIGATNTLSGLVADLCGGKFEGRVSLVVPHGETTNTHFFVEGTLRDADFRQVLSALGSGQAEEYRGVFSAEFQLEGPWGREQKEQIRGRGHVRVRKGRVFMLPLFGGLSHILTRVIPGLDFVLRQTDAESSFVISDGFARSDKVRVEGDVLSLEGKGTYGIVDHSLNFQVQIKLMKEHTFVGMLLRTITYPLSKIFEFRLTGTLENAVWYPINFSPELLRRIGLLEKEKPGETPRRAEPSAVPPSEMER